VSSIREINTFAMSIYKVHNGEVKEFTSLVKVSKENRSLSIDDQLFDIEPDLMHLSGEISSRPKIEIVDVLPAAPDLCTLYFVTT